MYRDKDLNKNKEATGFFEIKYKQVGALPQVPVGGRVKATKLRGIVSEGFWIELDKFEAYIHNLAIGDCITFPTGTEFDTVEGKWFVKKYIPQQTQGAGLGGEKRGKKAKVSLIVPDQFRFHIDTESLQRNLLVINPNDIISLTYKLHGTSGIFSKLLVKDTSLKSRISRAFKLSGGTKYDTIYSSRRVLKSGWLLPKNSQHYYGEDIWGSANLTISPLLQNGETWYGEIVGFVGEKPIQGQYDYGCNPGEFQVYIYRITYTNVDGKVWEMPAHQLQLYCKERGVNAVPELYYGYVHDLFPDIDYTDREWRDKFLGLLKEQYVEGKACYMCKNKVPAEGIVLRIDNSLTPKSYKLKNTAFLLHESKELDTGVINIEDNA